MTTHLLEFFHFVSVCSSSFLLLLERFSGFWTFLFFFASCVFFWFFNTKPVLQSKQSRIVRPISQQNNRKKKTINPLMQVEDGNSGSHLYQGTSNNRHHVTMPNYWYHYFCQEPSHLQDQTLVHWKHFNIKKLNYNLKENADFS